VSSVKLSLILSYHTCKRTELKEKKGALYFQKNKCVIVNSGTKTFCLSKEILLEKALESGGATEDVSDYEDEDDKESSEDEEAISTTSKSGQKRQKLPESESNLSMAQQYIKNKKKPKTNSISNDVDKPRPMVNRTTNGFSTSQARSSASVRFDDDETIHEQSFANDRHELAIDDDSFQNYAVLRTPPFSTDSPPAVTPKPATQTISFKWC
jgi:hypothetical protein